jgi:uncharacterized protein
VNIRDYIWLPQIEDKLEWKHSVQRWEVEKVFANDPYIRYMERGRRSQENVYAAYGQSDAGRYLVVFFIYKLDRRALILSARDMTAQERRLYERR